MACDPLYNEVVLLLNFSGTPGDTGFTDNSSYAHSVGPGGLGGCVLVNSPVLVAPTALKLPPNSSTVITATASEFNIASGDWCIEGYGRTQLGSIIQIPYENDGSSAQPAAIFLASTGGASAQGTRSGDNATCYNISGGSGWTDGAWHHFALVRFGSIFTLYVDGVVDGTTAYPLGGSSFAGNLSSNSGDITIGPNGGTPDCYLAGFRVTVGNARYTAPFTPPAAPFAIIACPVTFPVPDLFEETEAEAIVTLAATVFPLGAVAFEASISVPIGQITRQSPPATSQQLAGTPVNIWISTGAPSDEVVVPDIDGDLPADANAELLAAGVTAGAIDFSTDPSGTAGRVFRQGVPAGTVVPRGTSVPYTVSTVLKPFDVAPTVISQYANSPTILQLIANMNEYIRPDVDFEQFFDYVFNVDTAQGFGLDVWGKIVGVSRLLRITADNDLFGFANDEEPADWEPFNQGTFNTGNLSTDTYILPDSGYRTLVLTKALANICATTAPSLNRLLQNLFPGRGKAYVLDLGNMSMRFVFEFSLSDVEFAILTQSGALPHPAGVEYSVSVIPSAVYFGFSEQGSGVLPFDQGVFYP